MSSVLPLAASPIVASTERVLLSVGRNAEANFGSPVFAARPADPSQVSEFAALLPSDPAAAVVGGANTLAPAAANSLPSGPFVAAAVPVFAVHDAQIALPAADALATAVLPLAAESVVAPSQAAYAYAQMMQVWLESRTPRLIAARPVPKSKARERR
jgi:hypothetical protein